MGWHYILELRCKILPEFIDFYGKKYLDLFTRSDDDDTDLRDFYESDEATTQLHKDREYASFSKSYRDLIDIWTNLHIGSHFYEYDLSGDVFFCRISKKVNWHRGDLWRDLLAFVKDIIVPTSSEVTHCKIASDDYGDVEQTYTDLELRGGHLDLRNLVRSVEHTWEDGVISETRIVYKRGIPAIQQIDLDRLFTPFT